MYRDRHTHIYKLLCNSFQYFNIMQSFSKLCILDKDTIFEIFFFEEGRSHTFKKNIRLVHSW